MTNEIILQYKLDFLLELANNNYSLETVYNYARDLAVFEGFLQLNQLSFDDIDKRVITLYKGFLRSPVHYLEQLKSIDWDVTLDAFNFINRLTSGQKAPNRNHLTQVHSDQISARSINRMLSALRSYLRYLIDFDLKPVPVPPEAVKLIKIERKDSQVAEFKEILTLIECPSTLEKDPKIALRNRAMLELLFATGMRISEMLRLNRRDLNKEGKIYIMGKGKKQRFVYLTQRASFYVQEYLKTREDDMPALFVPYRGGRNGVHGQRISANYLQEKISQYRKIVGIVVPTSAHSLRHGFATYLAEQGANAAAIQILLGHESLHTTSRYVHPSDKFAQRTHHDFHPLYNTTDSGNVPDVEPTADMHPMETDNSQDPFIPVGRK